MPDLLDIYRTQAEDYHRLVAAEDYQGNLLKAIREITPLEGHVAVELGAGTGRVTALLTPLLHAVWAFDVSAHMLGVAQRTLRTLPANRDHRWQIGVADHRALPVAGGIADFAIAGWSISALAVYSGTTWEEQVRRGLTEMRRVVRSGGPMIIIETQGTGHETPNPPGVLLPYYQMLEREGFQSTWIRTDYRFSSLTESERLVRFFFGDELAAEVVRRQWMIVPECTGIWWRKA